MAEWRDIKGYEGYYQVSDEGEVRSVDRYDNRGEFRKGKIRQQSIDICGYKVINLNICGIKKRHSVHRLVAEAFLPNDDQKKEVNHINECKTDNRVCNLEWVTHTENMNYGTAQKRRIEKRIVPVIQLTKDGKILNEYKSIKEASLKTSVDDSAIGACVNGKRKTAGGFIWIKKSYQQAS